MYQHKSSLLRTIHLPCFPLDKMKQNLLKWGISIKPFTIPQLWRGLQFAHISMGFAFMWHVNKKSPQCHAEMHLIKNILRTDSVSIVWFTYCCVCHNGKILISCLLKQKSRNYGDSSNALQMEPHVDCHDYITH